ncbi:MAG TPA: Ig-like domain-containing protein [bacterium]|nr:Ig-like domain-containing protein [bacterium]
MKAVWLSVLILCAVASAQDTDPPYVDGMDPGDGENPVPIDTDIIFHCKDDLSPVDTDTIDFAARDTTLDKAITECTGAVEGVSPEPTRTIAGDLNLDDSDPQDVVCTFYPDDPLSDGDDITCTVDRMLADRQGNEMGEDFVWVFYTYIPDGVEEATWGEVKAREW